ncbi:metallopeptidase family protein [uncultured Corynebacterium sp.]|uniref:metallopeptidase family protein n=1 Tax=uncultured Corynebacterium sp. TaxID=159447 RepID=UPI0025DEE446|nr:metallopeptidase family protein [uncultured Corynebacterium sp.]
MTENGHQRGSRGFGAVRAAHRDPRGRGLRGILMPDLPRHSTRAEAFDAAVLDVYADVLDRFGDRLDGLDIAVDMIPRMRMDASVSRWSDEVAADGPVPLGRLVPVGVDERGAPTRPRLIVFRRPVEERANDRMELEQWLRFVIASLVATYLNVTPELVDPGFDWD